MMLLVDTDIILKLSVHGVLDLMPAAFDCPLEQLLVLPTATHQIKSNRSLKEKYPATALLRAQQFIDKRSVIQEPSKAVVQTLQSIDNIDAGEVILYGAAYRQKGALVLTDDKRSIRALSAAPNCSDITDRLNSRIFTISLVFIQLLSHYGLAATRKAVIIDDAGESQINRAFEKAAKLTESSVGNILREDLVKLRARSGALLATFEK